MKDTTTFFKPFLRISISLGAVAILWAAGSSFFEHYILPSPVETILNISGLWTPDLLKHISYTLIRVLSGFIFSFILGTAIGILAHIFEIKPAMDNLMMVIQVLPGIITGVIIFLLVGSGSIAPIILVITMTAPLIAINTSSALSKTDPYMKAVITSFKGDKWNFVFDLYIPHLVPAMKANASIGIAMAMKIALLGEFIAADNGIGFKINISRLYFNMEEVLFYLIIVMLSIVTFQLLIDIVFSMFFKKYFNQT